MPDYGLYLGYALPDFKAYVPFWPAAAPLTGPAQRAFPRFDARASRTGHAVVRRSRAEGRIRQRVIGVAR